MKQKNKKKQWRNLWKKCIPAMAGIMALFMAWLPCLAVQAIDGGTEPDTIDDSRKGSIKIHKYDMTAMEKDGLSTKTNETGFADLDSETKLSQYVISGVVFHYLKVAELFQHTSQGSVELLYGLSDVELASMIGLSTQEYSAEQPKGYSLKKDQVYYYNSSQLTKALAEQLAEKNEETKNGLEEYMTTHRGIAMAETNQDGMTNAQGLDTGLYLVVETYVPEDVNYTTDPFLVSIPTSVEDESGEAYWNYDINVYPKNQTDYPTIEKSVGDEDEYPEIDRNEGKELHDYVTASEGDTLTYRIVSRVPKIHSKSTFFTKFGYRDELSKGLNYKKDSVQMAWYDSLEKAQINDSTKAIALWNANDNETKFTVSFENEEKVMVIQMTGAGLETLNTKMSEKYVVVSYEVTANSDGTAVLGDAGNPNTATLIYSRTNTSYEDTLKDVANVFIYGTNLTKNFSDQQGDATKVAFILKNISDKQSDQTISYYIVATGKDGVYHVTGETSDKDDATVFHPGKDGVLKINGLEGDTYELYETATDDGYTRLAEPLTFQITSATALTKAQVKVTRATTSKEETGAAKTDTNMPEEGAIYVLESHASAKVNGVEANMSTDTASLNERVDLSITNQKGFTFPKTGDSGTKLFVLLGILLATGGALVAIGGEKKKH